MKISLLLDLDNTLLDNDMMGTFLPVYLKSLSRNFPQIPGEVFIKKLLFATQAMITKNQPRLTLEQAFDQIFYPALGIQKSEALPILNRFYEEEFGKLSYLSRPKPAAAQLVQRALDAGWDVVIATNPIFPKKAIQHRLNWAGISDDLPLAKITSYEKFHFAKPNPAYYAEILAQLGNPEQPAVMVGDSLQDDLLPASVLGIPGFLVTSEPQPIPDNMITSIQQGTLDQVWNWLEQISTQLVPPPVTNCAQSILATLNATPAALETLCLDLSPSQWKHQPEAKAWTLTEILCHMRDVDREVNLPRVHIMEQEEMPFLSGVDSDSWAEERHYNEQSGSDALNSFLEVRSEIIGLLNQLSPTGWEHPARHAIFGPTTLIELLGFVATHDTVHMRQVFQTIQ
jgi:FMN phosphatase YigB (HAD superfamily)/uncharacterized damage-inducible protein DinB